MGSRICELDELWPEREDLSQEFLRVLVSAQEGGATISECWFAAGQIDVDDGSSWFDAWMRTADSSSARAVAAMNEGNRSTARSNWLRAVNYYLTAAYPRDGSELSQKAIEPMREAAQNYLRLLDAPGEIVTIPWLSGRALQAYFLPAAATAKPAPAVICIGEPGQRKEQLLLKASRHARE